MSNPKYATIGGLAVTAMITGLTAMQGCNSGLSGAAGSLSNLDRALFADPSSSTMNGGFGDRGPLARFTELLGLTEDQQAQAKDIFAGMRADLQPLREQAHADILNVLTPDQQAKLEELRAQHPGPLGGPGPMGGMRAASDGAPAGHGMGPMGFGGPLTSADRDAMRQRMLDHLAEVLDLTDDQKTAIGTIQDNLHAAVDARRQQAMDEFRAILTADQLATLDQFKAMHQ